MNEVVDSLRRVSPHVVLAAVIGENGEIEAVSAQGDLDEVVGPAVTTLDTIATRAVQELGRGPLETAVLEGPYGRVVTRSIGDGRILVVVSEPNARLGLLMDDVRVTSDLLARGVAHV